MDALTKDLYIFSVSDVAELRVVGGIFCPTLTFTWAAKIVNNFVQSEMTIPNEIDLPMIQGFILKRLLSRDYNWEILFKAGDGSFLLATVKTEPTDLEDNWGKRDAFSRRNNLRLNRQPSNISLNNHSMEVV